MATEQDENTSPPHPHPPLLDVSERPAVTPGPLTKPSPTIRPAQKSRTKFLIIAAIILAAAIAAIAFLPPLLS